MVNGLYFYSASLVFQLKSTFTFTTLVSFHPFTHTHTLRAGCFSTKSQPAHQELIHTHWHTNVTGSSLVFSVLPKDTSACRPEEPGIKSPTCWLVDDTLYLLSHSRPAERLFTLGSYLEQFTHSNQNSQWKPGLKSRSLDSVQVNLC